MNLLRYAFIKVQLLKVVLHLKSIRVMVTKKQLQSVKIFLFGNIYTQLNVLHSALVS